MTPHSPRRNMRKAKSGACRVTTAKIAGPSSPSNAHTHAHRDTYMRTYMQTHRHTSPRRECSVSITTLINHRCADEHRCTDTVPPLHSHSLLFSARSDSDHISSAITTSCSINAKDLNYVHHTVWNMLLSLALPYSAP